MIIKTLKNIKFSCFKKINRDRKVEDMTWNLWKHMIDRNLFQELKKKNLNLMIAIFRICFFKFLIVETFKNMKFSCFKNWKVKETLFKCMINRKLSLDVIKNINLTIVIFRVLGAYSQYFIFSVTYELVWQVRVFGTCKPFQLSVMKHSSLLGRLVSYEENGVLWIRFLVLKFLTGKTFLNMKFFLFQKTKREKIWHEIFGNIW